MAAASLSARRSRLLRIAAALGAIVAIAGALRLAGALTTEDEPVDRAPLAAPDAEAPAPADRLPPQTIDVGGHPGAIAAVGGGVFVADAFSAEAIVLDPAAGPSSPLAVPLPGPASSVAAGADDVWFGLPGRRAAVRRPVLDPAAAAETVELDAFPVAVAADESGAWVLTENSVERVEAESGEAGDSLSAGGFATAFAVGGGAIWVVADNREVRRFDASSLEPADEIAEIADASAIAVGEGYAWVLAATGELTRLDTQSLRAVGDPVHIPGALALAVGEGAAWVTSADGRVTRVDPRSGRVVGSPVKAGDDPVAISAGAGAVWVANAGDGSVTRIAP